MTANGTGEAYIEATGGAITIGSLAGGFAVSSSGVPDGGNNGADGDAIVERSVDHGVSIGAVGGTFTVSDQGGGKAELTALDGDVTIGDVGGSFLVTDAQDGATGNALLDAFNGGITVGNVAGGLTISATDLSTSFAQISSDAGFTVASIGGTLSVIGTDGGVANLEANNDIIITNGIGGGLELTATASGGSADIVSFAGDIATSAIGGNVTLTATGGGNAYLESDAGTIALGNIVGQAVITADDAGGPNTSAYLYAGLTHSGQDTGGGDITIGSIGGDLNIFASDAATAFLKTNDGDITIGATSGNFEVEGSAVGYAYLQTNQGGDISVGTIGGGFTLSDTNDTNDAIGGATFYADGGGITFGAVTGSFTVSATGATSDYAELFAADNIAIDKGSAANAIGGDLIVSANDGGQAYIDPDGSVTIAGIAHDLTISSDGNGSTAELSGGILSHASTTGSVTIDSVGGDVTVTQTNGGTAEIFANDNVTFGSIGGLFDNAGTVEAFNGTLTFNGAITGTFTNAGTMEGGQIDITSAVTHGFENDGTVSVLDAAVSTIGVAVTGTGTFNIADGATLEFASSVAAGSTLTFAGSTGTIQFDDPADFHGQIAGISGTGDVLDLKGFAATDTASTAGNFDWNRHDASDDQRREPQCAAIDYIARRLFDFDMDRGGRCQQQWHRHRRSAGSEQSIERARLRAQ